LRTSPHGRTCASFLLAPCLFLISDSLRAPFWTTVASHLHDRTARSMRLRTFPHGCMCIFCRLSPSLTLPVISDSLHGAFWTTLALLPLPYPDATRTQRTTAATLQGSSTCPTTSVSVMSTVSDAPPVERCRSYRFKWSRMTVCRPRSFPLVPISRDYALSSISSGT
jgi:hypothetical protein